MHPAKNNVNLYLSLIRLKRIINKRKWIKRKLVSLKRAEAHRTKRARNFGRRSAISEMLARAAATELSVPQTSLALPIPSSFSMADSPESVIDIVARFAKTHCNKNLSDVFVDFSRVKKQDLGAHALLDKLVDEIASQAKFNNVKFGWRGTYPQDIGQQRFIRAMGIIKQLGLKKHYLHEKDAQTIHVFERHCRHYIRNIKPQDPNNKTEQANAAERFANHINRCLGRSNRELTKTARSRLCSYIVEIIDNAENHAGMIDWTIQGYLDVGIDKPECEIIIFNFGDSIAETMRKLEPNSFTKINHIDPFLALHKNRGFFGTKYREEELLTLIALQGAVSSRNTSDDTTRGQGTADLIEFFQGINEDIQGQESTPASMYIISGSTRIIFDGTYKIKRTVDNQRIIAFNDKNDLNSPPDPKFVMPLQGTSLPGTMIGIKFPIQARNLKSRNAATGHVAGEQQ